jgi:hypothetical protein
MGILDTIQQLAAKVTPNPVKGAISQVNPFDGGKTYSYWNRPEAVFPSKGTAPVSPSNMFNFQPQGPMRGGQNPTRFIENPNPFSSQDTLPIFQGSYQTPQPWSNITSDGIGNIRELMGMRNEDIQQPIQPTFNPNGMPTEYIDPNPRAPQIFPRQSLEQPIKMQYKTKLPIYLGDQHGL